MIGGGAGYGEETSILSLIQPKLTVTQDKHFQDTT